MKRKLRTKEMFRIWGPDGYRVFLSHRVAVKAAAAKLKDRLRPFGISAFVAHRDIHPTKEWQNEIENALRSMDAFVAIRTKKFHESSWTDQEVGYALCRDVPIIALLLGATPYGFIGKFQALTCQWAEVPEKIVKLLIKEPGMLDAYLTAAKNCESFDAGNDLSRILPSIDAVDSAQVKKLVSAFNHNPQLNGSWGFNGERAYNYGGGLAMQFLRITGHRFKTRTIGSDVSNDSNAMTRNYRFGS